MSTYPSRSISTISPRLTVVMPSSVSTSTRPLLTPTWVVPSVRADTRNFAFLYTLMDALAVSTWNTERLHFQDAWRWRENLTLNYGLAWMMDGYKNYDLGKPAFLAPILGESGLAPAHRNWKNFSPSVGLAWAPTRDRRTVIRAGAGIYYDFFFQNQIDAERALLGPAAQLAFLVFGPMVDLKLGALYVGTYSRRFFWVVLIVVTTVTLVGCLWIEVLWG